MNKIRKTVYFINKEEVLIFNDLTAREIILLRDGLAFEYAIEQSEVKIAFMSAYHLENKSMDAIKSIVIRFANKWTWN